MAVVVMTGAWAQTSPEKQPNGSWKFTMPAANKLLEVENYNTYTLTLSHNAGHGTVELLRPGSSAAVGTAENAFQYCYDCQRSPAYPTVANNGHNNLSGFSAPYVGLAGIGYGYTNSSTGPWKLEYVGQYSHSEYNFSVSGVRHTYGLNSDEDVPIFLLFQWDGTQYQPVVYGVACAYSKLNNTHDDDHTLLFVAEGHWGCFLSNNQHSQDLNIDFDEDLSMGMDDFAEAATPSLPEGVTDNGNGTYTVVSGTELTIEAIANSAEHYYFNNWTNEQGSKYTTGVVTPTGPRPATSLLTLTITGDTTVRGKFRIDTFDLTLSTNNANMGHIDIGGQQYESKDTMLTDHQHIDVAAIPEPGHYFVNWTDANGIEKSKNTHIMVTAISDTTLTANFAPYAILQIASNNNAWGTVALQAGTTGNHELTLYDESESTSNHLIPAYTCWFDALTRSQHVIPATKLAEVKGGTISSIKYYAQDPVTWTSSKNIDVYLKEVTNTTLNSLVEKNSCTVVYNGQLNVVDGIVTITFSSPFSYNGGNLLVGIENLEAGNYNCGVSFLGEDVPGASIGGQGGNFTQQDFLPMSTFTYQTAGAIENTDGSYSVIPGTEVTVTATPANDNHFVNWTDENSNVMGTDAQLTFTVTGDTAVTGNFAGEEYRLDSVRTTWDVYINGAQTPIHSTAYSANDTLGYVMIPGDADVVITPQPKAQAEKVSKLELIEKNVIDLDTITADFVAQNGDILINALATKHQISIADGATITLRDASINASNTWSDGEYAGITCLGDATIILKDGTTNTVRGFHENYPGIYVPAGSTLTIKGGDEGTGTLIASSNGSGAGIGGGRNIACGSISIKGGTIEATGGNDAAGIGGGYQGNCGAIQIAGGTVTATGGKDASGIGSGSQATCTGIIIANTVTTVTAIKGMGDHYQFTTYDCIGKGGGGSCEGILFNTQMMYSNSAWTTTPTSGTIYGGLMLIFSTISYDNADTWTLKPVTVKPAVQATTEDVGKVIGADGNIYPDAITASEAHTTARAIIAYVGSAGSVDAGNASYKGLAIAMDDANSYSCTWADVNHDCLGITSYSETNPPVDDKSGISYTNTLTNDGHGHNAATIAKSNYDIAAPMGTSGWFLPSLGQWNLIVQGLATKKIGSAVTTDLTNTENDAYTSENLNSVITSAGGTGLKSSQYWSSRENPLDYAWMMNFVSGSAGLRVKNSDCYVRSVIAF